MLAHIPSAHAEVVTSLTFSPHTTGQHLLCSTSGDHSAILWSVCPSGDATATLQHVAQLNYHSGPVNTATFHPEDVNLLVTASDDRRIAIWDIRRPQRPVGVIGGFHDGINKLIWLPPSAAPAAFPAPSWCLVSACDDGLIYIHALQPCSQPASSPQGDNSSGGCITAPFELTATLIEKFWVSTSTVNDVVYCPRNRVLITASEDAALRSWRVLYAPDATTEDRLTASLDEFENPVNHVVIVPPGLMEPQSDAANARLGVGGGHGEVDEEEDSAASPAAGAASGSGAPSRVLMANGLPPPAMVLDEQRGCWLLAASSECVFGVDYSYELSTFGEEARSFVGHRDYVRGIEFTGQGTMLTVSDDSTVVEWEVASGSPIRQVKLHEGMIMASALSPARDILATGTDGGEIRLWRLPFQTERMSC